MAEAAGLRTEGLARGRRDVFIGVASLLIENVGLKSVSLLEIEVPLWVERVDGILLVVGLFALWARSRECLIVANAHASNSRRMGDALGIKQTFSLAPAPGMLGLAPSEIRRSDRKAMRLIRPAQWMIDDDDSGLGFFIVSQTQGFVAMPGGSQGNLCLTGSIGRYMGPGQIQTTGNGGAFFLSLDLTQTPQPTGPVSVIGGETWNFQAWHRDIVGGAAASNLTDGLQIDFL